MTEDGAETRLQFMGQLEGTPAEVGAQISEMFVAPLAASMLEHGEQAHAIAFLAAVLGYVSGSLNAIAGPEETLAMLQRITARVVDDEPSPTTH